MPCRRYVVHFDHETAVGSFQTEGEAMAAIHGRNGRIIGIERLAIPPEPEPVAQLGVPILEYLEIDYEAHYIVETDGNRNPFRPVHVRIEPMGIDISSWQNEIREQDQYRFRYQPRIGAPVMFSPLNQPVTMQELQQEHDCILQQMRDENPERLEALLNGRWTVTDPQPAPPGGGNAGQSTTQSMMEMANEHERRSRQAEARLREFRTITEGLRAELEEAYLEATGQASAESPYEKSMVLLKSCLTRDELEEFETFHTITIRTKIGLFRVNLHGRNVDEQHAPSFNVSNGEHRLCLVVSSDGSGPVPRPDHILAQVLLLKGNPELFLQRANVEHY